VALASRCHLTPTTASRIAAAARVQTTRVVELLRALSVLSVFSVVNKSSETTT
jgi:hypothetical protein